MPRQISNAMSAAQDWKSRMAKARAALPKGKRQQAVIDYIVKVAPDLERLTNFSRWHNAWHCRVADTEITPLVEQAAQP